MKKLGLIALIALVLAMVAAACGGGGEAVPEPTERTGEVVTTGGGPTKATSGEEPEPTEQTVVEVSPTESAEPTEEDVDLGNVSEGLDQLSAYKTKLDMRFTGKDAQGVAVEKTWVMEEAFILEPRAQQIGWTSSESTGGATPTVTKWEMITIGTTAYMLSTDAEGTETCVSFSSDESTPPEPGLSPDMWGSVTDARYVGTETVNGVRAKHYVWREGAFGLWGLAGGKGDTWLAVDGGYAVRQSVEAEGKGVFLANTGDEGKTTWQWDVTDIEGSFEILPPEGCESASSDIPMMPDAENKTTFGDMISYTSPSAFADVVDFYKAEMPAAGWQASGTPTEMEGFATLEYTKENRTASIMISRDASASATTVIVTTTEQ